MLIGKFNQALEFKKSLANDFQISSGKLAFKLTQLQVQYNEKQNECNFS